MAKVIDCLIFVVTFPVVLVKFVWVTLIEWNKD